LNHFVMRSKRQICCTGKSLVKCFVHQNLGNGGFLKLGIRVITASYFLSDFKDVK
jgi:hypothetical protein